MHMKPLSLVNNNQKFNQTNLNKKNHITNSLNNISFQAKEDVFLKTAKNNMNSLTKLNQPFKKAQQLITSAKKFVGRIFAAKKETDLLITSAKKFVGRIFATKKETDLNKPQTIQQAVLFDNMGKIRKKYEYDLKTNKKTRIYFYLEDGKNIGTIHDLDLQTGNVSQVRTYRHDTQTLSVVDEYNPKNDTILQSRYYQEDGKTLSRLEEFVPDKGILNKVTIYKKDGKTIEKIKNYDSKTGELINTQYFNN